MTEIKSDVPKDKLLNVENLKHYFNKLFNLNISEPPRMKYFTNGQSNPTYYVEFGEKKFVLKKKPIGSLLPSAHQIEREYHIMSRLDELSTGLPEERRVPVPKMIHFCKDTSIIGTTFYLMQYVDGIVVFDVENLSPRQRSAIYTSMSRVMAALHSYDATTLNLPQFFKDKPNYLEHNVDVWRRQYQASSVTFQGRSTDTRQSERTYDWLKRNLPQQISQNTLIHGDLRVDNMIFDADNWQVKAVVDWELSTLGDPRCDVAMNCFSYYQGLSGSNPMSSLRSSMYRNIPLGVPELEEYLRMYLANVKSTGVEVRDMKNIDYYVVHTYYKVAAIVQGVFKRMTKGQASQSKVAALMETTPSEMCSIAMKLADKIDSRKYVLPISLSVLSTRVQRLYSTAKTFIDDQIRPLEKEFEEWYNDNNTKWSIHPKFDALKEEAKSLGLWNMFLSVHEASLAREVVKQAGIAKDLVISRGLSNVEYAYIAELTGTCLYASEVMNCSAPDTGNMEVLLKYASRSQQIKWLPGLLSGDIRSCFAMTEPAVASSDASNIESSIDIKGGEIVLNGRKFFTSGANHPRCKLAIFMGKSSPLAPRHRQQSLVLVAMETSGVRVLRAMSVFGYDHAPYGHGEVTFTDVRVPSDCLVFGEGRGFQMAQGRLGAGRVHHCMRTIGATQLALQLMTDRAKSRTVFSSTLSSYSSVQQDIARSRIAVEQNRLLVLKCALVMDIKGNKEAVTEIAMIKLAVGKSSQKIVDSAIQIFGAAGVSQDTPLAHAWSMCRVLRLMDGPDEVHARTLAAMQCKL